MRIGANNHIPRVGQILGHQLVAHAATYLIKKTAAFFSKGTQKPVVIGKLSVWARGGVVQKYYCSLRLSYGSEADFLELLYGQRAGNILDKNQVHIGDDNVPSFGIAMRLVA